MPITQINFEGKTVRPVCTHEGSGMGRSEADLKKWPDLFADMKAKKQYHDWNGDYYYNQVHTQGHGKAGDCIRCGKCEKACPRHLEIRKLLEKVAEVFEK